MQLLGGLRLVRDGQPVAGKAAHRRRLALLVLLSSAPKRRLSRERLIDFLWEDATVEAGRKLLSESLYVLRSELGDSAISSVGDEVELDPTVVPSDLDCLLEMGERRDDEALVQISAAAFLDGWYLENAPGFSMWVDTRRETVRSTLMRVYSDAAARLESADQWTPAIEGWRRAVEIDGCSAPSVTRLATALGRTGDRAEALRVIAVHRALLQADLGIEPDSMVLDAERALRASAPGVPSVVSPQAPASPTVAPPISAPLAAPPQSGEPPVEQPIVVSPPPRAAKDRGLLWKLGLAAAVVVAAIGGWRWNSTNAAPTAANLARVAIYSQSLASRDSALSFLREALTNGVTNQLSVNSFTVASSGEVRAMESGRISLDSLVAMRSLGTLVELAFESRDDRLRVTVRVVDAASRDQVASSVYDRPTADALRLETDIVAFIADVLKRRLRTNVLLRDANEGTRDPYVRKLLVAATRLREDAEGVISSGYALDKESARDLLLSADSLLQRAIVQDARWPTLWVERARTMLARAVLVEDAARVALTDSGVRFADAALAISRDDAQALAIRGILHFEGARTFVAASTDSIGLQRADRDLRRSLDLEPAQASTWLALSRVQNARGQSATSLASARRAIEYDAFLENGQRAYFVLFASALTSGALKDAAMWCKRGQQVYPDDFQLRLCELTVMRELPRSAGDDRLAWRVVATIDSMAALQPRAPEPRYSKAYRNVVAAGISAQSGDARTAREGLARAKQLVAGDPVLQADLMFDEAYVHLALGDRAKAVQILRQLITVRPPLKRILASAPLFRELASEFAEPTASSR